MPYRVDKFARMAYYFRLCPVDDHTCIDKACLGDATLCVRSQAKTATPAAKPGTPATKAPIVHDYDPGDFGMLYGLDDG
jgi:hypothetical protein